MPRPLKVYVAPLGFFESVVAAPSKAAALRAWGVHQDLFASGEAEVTTDQAAVKAATAHPGVPLKRPVGGKGDFELDPRLPDTPAGKRRAVKAKPKPDRAALDAAEARLKKVEDDQAAGQADFERRREALEAEAGAARKRWDAERERAEADVERRQRAFDRASGRS
jgi:hypothetical protein